MISSRPIPLANSFKGFIKDATADRLMVVSAIPTLSRSKKIPTLHWTAGGVVIVVLVVVVSVLKKAASFGVI